MPGHCVGNCTGHYIAVYLGFLDIWCRLRPDERLDWMYGGGMVAQMDAEKRSEQALLGERLPDANDQPVEVSAHSLSWNNKLFHDA